MDLAENNGLMDKLQELGPHTKVVVQLSSIVVVLGVITGGALWADGVTDSLESINDALQEMRSQVVGLDSLNLRRRVQEAWVRELRISDKAFLEQLRVLNEGLPLRVPERVIPDIPLR